ncbi:Cruciform DNA-recognizing protein 1 [Neolecta irregularis DAH-3]|uniref:Cruciform DNA-recognizing protein 1 n=1 Tax=Neolecta irregularis (strain DAH-3) TaxID=1198029 RepID=A0A1U7LU82_NEOID|nr:Cruciform DNA-recognizing protein 1 [Neolecta irregularis DAH-3]|eukprot:OLL26204.1 Cruciform DNA-recognizing protein 1 [Neolecta irregularis DAH-3]
MSDKSIPFTFVWHYYLLKPFLLSRSHTKASEVYVTGSFDNWSKSVKLDYRNGRFEKTVLLAAEDIFFKASCFFQLADFQFVVDGNWIIDPTKEKMIGSDGYENNVFRKEYLLSEASLSSVKDSNVTFSAITNDRPEPEILAVPKDEVAMKEEGKRIDVAANDSRPSTATSSSSKKSKKKKKKSKAILNMVPVEQDEEADSHLSKDTTDVSYKEESRPTTACLDETPVSWPATAIIPEVVSLSEAALPTVGDFAELNIASYYAATEEPAAEIASLTETESQVPVADSSHMAISKSTREAFDYIEPLERATAEKIPSRPMTARSIEHALVQPDVLESPKDQARLSAAREIIEDPEFLSPTVDLEEGSIPDSVNEESVQKVSSRPHTAKSAGEVVGEGKVIEESFVTNAASHSSSKPARNFVDIVKEDPVATDLLISKLDSNATEESPQTIEEIQKLGFPSDEISRPHTAEKPANPIIVDQEFSPPPTAEEKLAIAGEFTLSAADKFTPPLGPLLVNTENAIHDELSSNPLKETPVEQITEQPQLEKEVKESFEVPDHTSESCPVDIAAFNSAQPATDLGGNPVGDPVDSSSIKESTSEELVQETGASPASRESLKTFTNQLDNAFSTVRGKKPVESDRPGSAHKDSVVGDTSTTRKDDAHEEETFFRKLRRIICDIL